MNYKKKNVNKINKKNPTQENDGKERKYYQSNAQPAVGSVEEDERNDVGVDSLQGTAPKLTLRPVNHHSNIYQHKLTPHPGNHQQCVLTQTHTSPWQPS